MRAAEFSNEVHVTIESGASFTSGTPYVLIRNDSSITNAADLSVNTDNTSVFEIVGSGSSVVNTGTLTVNALSAAINVFGGVGNSVRNDGFILATRLSSGGITIQNSHDVTIINNGQITSTPLTGIGYAIRVTNNSTESSRTINNGLLASAAGAAFRSQSGSDRLENFGEIRGAAAGPAASLGAGNDTYVIGAGSSFNTYIDAGTGSGDTIAFGTSADTLDVAQIGATGAYRAFEIIEKIGTLDGRLTGNNADALRINVTEGLLNMEAVMAASAVSVGDGATLIGTGTAGALTVASGGTFAPGGRTSIGTFTAASATFAEGSTFRVRVNDQGASDRVQVNGVATINGGRVSVDVSGGYSVNTPYRILTATSLAGGRFQSATASLALLQPVLSYDATNVYVTLERTTQPPDNPNNPDTPNQPDPPNQPDQPDNPNEPDNPADPDDPTPPVITLDQIGRTWNQISTGRALE